MFVAVVQGGIGYLQYFNDIPAALVAAHVAGATALWVVTVQLIQAAVEPTSGGPVEREVHQVETTAEQEVSAAVIPGV
jgi:cytochrome c oxidase assembly protein subunit 15